MPSSYTLGNHFESFVQGQLATGRYSSASEVLRDALRLMEEREKRLEAFHSSIREGLTDAVAGRVHDAGEVFDELEAELAALPDSRA